MSMSSTANLSETFVSVIVMLVSIMIAGGRRGQ